MRKLAVLLSAIGLAAASLASADTAQLELMPKVGGSEIAQHVRDEGSSPMKRADEFHILGTGRISPLVSPPAVEEPIMPLVYCHAQGGEVVNAVCVNRRPPR